MSKRAALGRGIEALIQSMDEVPADPAEGKNDGIKSVPLRLVETNPDQPRKTFNEETLHELADSIREQGVIQPIIVEQSDDRYIIIAGERRFRAARMAGLSEIPVIIRKFTDEEKLEIALVENIQREDLNPIEEAMAYRQLLETTGMNQETIARKVGKNRSTVANSLRLLKLPEEIRDSIMNGELSSGHARALLSVLNPADLRILFSRIMNDGLSVREAENQAAALNKGSRLTGHRKETPSAPKVPELSEMEQKFLDVFGTKVSIKGGLRKGKIEISYYSLDDLERIYDLLIAKRPE